MVWAVTTNSDSSDDSLTVNKGREITLNDGNTYSFDLPDDDVAVADQEYFLEVRVSDGSSLQIRTMTTRPSGTQTVMTVLYVSAAVHFMFDGTNDKWRVVSFDELPALSQDHMIAALDGGFIKDQGDNLIAQSSIQFHSVYVPPANILDDGPVIRHVIDNTVAGNFWDAIELYYGFPGTDEIIPVDIRAWNLNGYYPYTYFITAIHSYNTFVDQVKYTGFRTSEYTNPRIDYISGSFTPNSNALDSFNTLYLYV